MQQQLIICPGVTFGLPTILSRLWTNISVPAGWTLCQTMRTKVILAYHLDEPWLGDQCRPDFGLKQKAHLRVNWEQFVRFQVRANVTKSEAKRQFIDRNCDVLRNAQSPHRWWSTLKPTVFGSSSSLPSLVGGGGWLMCESVFQADLLSDHIDSKQSRKSVDLPLTCHPSPSLIPFDFRSSEVRHLLLDVYTYGGTAAIGHVSDPMHTELETYPCI